jgi:hypothetical protein
VVVEEACDDLCPATIILSGQRQLS